MAVERELYQKLYQEIKVGEVINDFDVARCMKIKLIHKDIQKKESELTALEKKERADTRKDMKKFRQTLRTSQMKIRKFEKPQATEHSNDNCFLIMQACNNDKAFYHYKKRDVQLQVQDLKPKYLAGDSEPKSARSNASGTSTKRQLEKFKMIRLSREEMEKLRVKLEEEEQAKKQEKINRYQKFKQDRESVILAPKSPVSSRHRGGSILDYRDLPI